MQQNDALLSPAPPQIKGALRNGFDSIANHIYLIAIPVIVDVFLWLGPHIRLKSLTQPILEAILSTSSRQIEQSIEVIRTNQELLLEWFTRLNLMIILRSFPIGIPSLMASRLPIGTPTGDPAIIEIYSFWHIPVLILVIGLLGLMLGTLFYILIAQVALEGKIMWNNLINFAPWAILQIILMTCTFYLLVIFLSLPISCMLSLFTLTGFTQVN